MHSGSTIGFSIALCTAALAVPCIAHGGHHGGPDFQGVPNANPKATGVAVPDVLTPELIQAIVAQGSNRLEDPTTNFPFYGYDGDGPMVPAPGAIQSKGNNVEATKTEPDKNTYLVLCGQHGFDPGYDYGTHFLFQGHELGIADPNTGLGMGYITRVNLDADGAHRVTLMASQDVNGNPIPVIDGSTFDPWADRLLFTCESGTAGGVWQATVDYPSTVVDLAPIFGKGGYEGIQNDSDGNVWFVEDVGGAKGAVNKHAKQPNSFVYRFIPADRTDLTKGGKVQALQVMSLANPGQPIVFHAGQADADILSQDVKDLHTYGLSFTTNWVTLHDTAVDGFNSFDANAVAKTLLATPFKRPENGQFRPGSKFGQFVFDETGDTDTGTEAGSAFGGFGAILKLTQKKPSDSSGTLKLVFNGDVVRNSFDNCAFWDKNNIVFVEDAGDTLHGQRNGLDSAYLVDLEADYADPSTELPVRILAEGRDASATLDSGYSAAGNGFQNEGDNEITGFHVSDGDASTGGILGAKTPRPFEGGWRVFYTQQHGDNVTWEILEADGKHGH
jgi:hypothetical protein